MRIEQINSGNAKIAIIAAQKEKADSKSAVDDPTSDLTSYARKVSPMTAVLYEYYSNPGCASYQSIDFNAHARKVFSLLQHCLRESENLFQQPVESQKAVCKLRMEFYRYVIGMSLPKLAVYTEQHDIRSQTSWVGFHAFLKHPVKAEDFEIQPNNKLHWSQTDRNDFLAILKLNGINLNPGEKQIFFKPPCESSSDGALEDATTNDAALSLRVNSEKAIKDEKAGDNDDTHGAANADPKEPQAEGCYDLSTWRTKYQQWISNIVRQSKATSSLVGLNQKGHTQWIENLSFTPIHTGSPTSGMEDWIQTIKRAFAVEIPGRVLQDPRRGLTISKRED
ncbi:MAG: hypothetical protein Q9204_004591 [Flavoplaca sp. TL-2023a]